MLNQIILFWFFMFYAINHWNYYIIFKNSKRKCINLVAIIIVGFVRLKFLMKNESERLWWYCVLAGFIYFEHQEFIFIYVYDELWLSRLHHLQIICLYKVVKIDLRDKYHITWCDRIGCSIVIYFPLKMTFQVCKRGEKKEEFTVWRPIENIFFEI